MAGDIFQRMLATGGQSAPQTGSQSVNTPVPEPAPSLPNSPFATASAAAQSPNPSTITVPSPGTGTQRSSNRVPEAGGTNDSLEALKERHATVARQFSTHDPMVADWAERSIQMKSAEIDPKAKLYARGFSS